jgi:hypothetical protein
MAASNVSVVNSYADSVDREAGMTKEEIGLRRNGRLGCGSFSRCVQTVDAYGRVYTKCQQEFGKPNNKETRTLKIFG